ncbi:hypothetical protein DIPPA_27062 [Diplonema papillatum]|nr:hypothetical protein DIPPA_27062 [Diplonema papillatum]|eukprot:gene17221-26442_t
MIVDGGALVVGGNRLGFGLGGVVDRKIPPAGHRKAIVLASMYQRIPNDVLERAEGKTPSSFAVLRVPWRDDGRHKDYSVVMGKGDAKMALWYTHSLPRGSTLEDALHQIETVNASEERVLKYQIMFADGSRLRFEREHVTDPRTLQCKEFYSIPRNAAAAKVRPATFTTNAKGHLKTRKKLPLGTNSLTPSVKSAYSEQSFTTRSANFAFTPVGFTRFRVKPNANYDGVRPTLRERSLRAYHYRPRPLYTKINGSYTVSVVGNDFPVADNVAASLNQRPRTSSQRRTAHNDASESPLHVQHAQPLPWIRPQTAPAPRVPRGPATPGGTPPDHPLGE